MRLEHIVNETFLGHLAQECITVPSGLTEKQYEAAYQEHGPYIRRIFGSLSPDTIDDLSQIAWMRAWENRHQYTAHRGSVKTWIANIAKNVLADHHRRNSITPEQVPLPSGSDDDPREDDFLTTPSEAPATNLRHDLAAILTADDMRLLPLMEAGLTGKEMSTALGITEKACETRVMRLRKRVQKYLSE